VARKIKVSWINPQENDDDEKSVLFYGVSGLIEKGCGP